MFLKNRPRYSKLFTLRKEDYKGWAKELKAAGYATDVKYPDKIIGIIERYKLYEYDKEVLGNSYVEQVVPIDIKTETVAQVNTSGYIVEKGDTLYSISKKFNLTVEDLKRLNGLSDNALSIGQQLIVKP